MGAISQRQLQTAIQLPVITSSTPLSATANPSGSSKSLGSLDIAFKLLYIAHIFDHVGSVKSISRSAAGAENSNL